MDSPKFGGEDPMEWIRQCNKYFQMPAAHEDYKVSLAQLCIIGEAGIWFRRLGLLEKLLTWHVFCKELTKQFSTQGSYGLRKKCNTVKQTNQRAVE